MSKYLSCLLQCILLVLSDGYHVVTNVLTAHEKNGSYCTPLQNNNLIFKNLAFCTVSRKKKSDLSISAEFGEKNKTRG